MAELSQKTIHTVKSTAPLLAEQGAAITAAFYDRLFVQHPELLNVFNQANQRQGTQAEALFNAVLAYASNIENIAAIAPAVTHIAHKHASLGIKPDQYPVVGKHLLATIQDTFELPDGHDILVAWAEAYQLLADIFIQAEEGIYKINEAGEQGWRDFKPFIIDRIVVESPLVRSFYLKSMDGLPVQNYQGGQYISVRVRPEGSEYAAIRQYSLSDFSDENCYRISTKREDHGVVTQYMHNLSIGDQIEVHAPTGIFTLDQSAEHHVFISGGVGITALLGMLKQLAATQGRANATFIQCVRDKSHELFADEILAASALGTYKLCLTTGQEGDAEGRITEALLRDWLPDKTATVYLCGPRPFMQSVYQALLAIGFADDAIHYEVFGPNASLQS
jgi:nitric oxide dioxygenase